MVVMQVEEAAELVALVKSERILEEEEEVAKEELHLFPE